MTGKVAGNWNVGFLSALTAREYADVDDLGDRSRQEVEPFSNYSVLRAQKEFHQGRQGLGFIATGVFRDLDNPGLREILNRQALVLGADGWLQLGKKQTWALTGWLGASRVTGSRDSDPWTCSDRRCTTSSVPTPTTWSSIPRPRPWSGWAGRLALNKQKGNVVFNAALGAVSPGFEVNDLGYQWRGDYVNSHLVTGYNWLQPGKVFRSAQVFAAMARGWDFGGNAVMKNSFLFLYGEFLNYWSSQIELGYIDASYDKEATRGGPLLRLPPGYLASFSVYSDSRKPLVMSLFGEMSRRNDGSRDFEIGPQLRWKPRSNVSLTLHPEVEFYDTYRQWVANVDDELNAATYGKRYVFALLEGESPFGRDPPELDILPEDQPAGLPAAADRRGQVRRVQGAGAAGDLCVQLLRPRRLDDRRAMKAGTPSIPTAPAPLPSSRSPIPISTSSRCAARSSSAGSTAPARPSTSSGRRTARISPTPATSISAATSAT